MDIIFEVHDGVIAAEGIHEELLKSCDYYANLVRGWIEYDSDLYGLQMTHFRLGRFFYDGFSFR